MKIAILTIIALSTANLAQSQTTIQIGDWKFSEGWVCSLEYDGWFHSIKAVKLGPPQQWESRSGHSSSLEIQRWKDFDLRPNETHPVTVDNGAAQLTYPMRLKEEGYRADQHLYLGEERGDNDRIIYSFLDHISENSEFRMFIDYLNVEDYEILTLSLDGTSEALLAFSNCLPHAPGDD